MSRRISDKFIRGTSHCLRCSLFTYPFFAFIQITEKPVKGHTDEIIIRAPGLSIRDNVKYRPLLMARRKKANKQRKKTLVLFLALSTADKHFI